MNDTLWQDLRYAGRSLRRRPLVTGVAVLSLALGVGVNTAMFSVFDRLLLAQLPVPSPDQLVTLTSPGPRPGNVSTNDSGDVQYVFNYPLFRDLERIQTVFTALGGFREIRPISRIADRPSAPRVLSRAATFRRSSCGRRSAAC